jgi:hypothetical protein
MVLFKINSELEEHENALNVVLKADRQSVESWAIGLKRMKWRRLKFLDFSKLENAHTMLMVAACLHNFSLEYDGWINDGPIVNLELYLHEDDDFENDDVEENLIAGMEKRRGMAEDLIV